MDAALPEPPHGRRGDTRARIRQVALELFAEQGYERTSLREIAERLGVTKAALYYHFKSKEDIVRSFTEDYFVQLDALIAWAREQPPSPDACHAIFQRYIDIVLRGNEVFRFLEQNQAALRSIEGGKHRFEQFRPRLAALVELIVGPDPAPRARIRATAALFAISASCMLFMPGPHGVEADEDTGCEDADREGAPCPSTPRLPDPDELRKIVLEIADDLTAAATASAATAAPRGQAKVSG